MKKYVLILFALVCSIMSVRAIDLKEAYVALSHLPKVSTVLDDTVSVTIDKDAKYAGTMEVARALNLKREEIKTTGDATLAVLNQVPLKSMINGGYNGLVGAFVYCAVNEGGTNDMLIVTMNGEQGDLTYLFVTDLDEYSKLCLQEAKLTMAGSSLSIVPRARGGVIGAIKVNCR